MNKPKEKRWEDRYCTDKIYMHWTKHMKYTDGIKEMAEDCEAYWLIDILASYQGLIKRNHPRLRDFQLWELRVKDNTGIITCCGDSGERAIITQEIEYTDFPLDYIKIWVEDDVALFPNEH